MFDFVTAIVFIDKGGKLLKIYCCCITCVCVGREGGKGGVLWGEILDFSFWTTTGFFSLLFNI